MVCQLKGTDFIRQPFQILSFPKPRYLKEMSSLPLRVTRETYSTMCQHRLLFISSGWKEAYMKSLPSLGLCCYLMETNNNCLVTFIGCLYYWSPLVEVILIIIGYFNLAIISYSVWMKALVLATVMAAVTIGQSSKMGRSLVRNYLTKIDFKQNYYYY